MRQIAYRLLFTHDQRVPMPTRPLNQIAGFWHALDLAVALNLDRTPEFAWHTQYTPIKPHILAFGKLAQVDAVPLVAAFEAWKTPIIILMLQEGLKGFRQPIGQALHGSCRNRGTTPTLKQRGQIVLGQELLCLLIVLLLTSKHLVVQQTRLVQARIKAAALIAVGIEA